MRTPLVIGALLLVALTGCIDGDSEPAPVAAGEETATPTPESYRVDETFDLAPTGMDETWQWSMDPNTTGAVVIEYTAEPTSLSGARSICFTMEWPEGDHRGGSGCGGVTGGVNIQCCDAAFGFTTIYDVELVPNSFELHVWTPRGADTASVRVMVQAG